MLISNLVSTFPALKKRRGSLPSLPGGAHRGKPARVVELKVVFKDLNFKDEGMKIILGPHRAPGRAAAKTSASRR